MSGATLTESPSSPSMHQSKELERDFGATTIAVLHITTPTAAQFTYDITRTRTIIGRAEQACHCLIPSPIVSKQHVALYVYSNGLIFAEDLGSANGTSLDVAPGSPTVLPLDKGKQVQVLVGQTLVLGGQGKVRVTVAELRLDALKGGMAQSATAAGVSPTLVECPHSDDDDDEAPPPAVAFGARSTKMQAVLEAQRMESTPTRAGLLLGDGDDETPPVAIPFASRKGTSELQQAVAASAAAPASVEAASPCSLASFVITPVTKDKEDCGSLLALSYCGTSKPAHDPQQPTIVGEAAALAPPAAGALAATLIVSEDDHQVEVLPPQAREIEMPSLAVVASSPVKRILEEAEEPFPAKAARQEAPNAAPTPTAKAACTSPAAASPAKRTPKNVAPAPVATSAPAAPPPPLPPTAVWQFKVDLRKSNTKDDAWEDYSATDSATIEAAHVLFSSSKKPKKSLTEVKLNATYGVHFEDMVQFRFDDRSRQRPVRRIVK